MRMLTIGSSLRVGVVKVMSLLIDAGHSLGFSFGVRALTKMKISCIKVAGKSLGGG